MSRLLQTLLDSVTVGSLYGLIALGYTMVYGILQFINFAHSDVFMLGAWLSYTTARLAGWSQPGTTPPLWAAPFVLLVAMALCGSLGFGIERLAYKPLRKAPRLNVLITAIGVSLLIENTGQLKGAFGPQPASMPKLLPDVVLFSVFDQTTVDEVTGASVVVPGVQFHLVDMLVIGVAVALMVLLQWLVYGTKLGLGMRAVSYDTRTASLMGINVDRVISLTFVIGSSLAAAAGLLFALKYPGLKQSADSTWVLLGLKAFVAAVVGGIGNVRGAVVGGLLIGVIEELGVAYLNTSLRDVYVFALLILVLLLKPTGLLGKPIVEKV